jgi:hypothetical protein
MGITIRKVGVHLRFLGRYEATVEHDDVNWSTPRPIGARSLTRKLYDLGCHTTDISDAFHAAELEWRQARGGTASG